MDCQTVSHSMASFLYLFLEGCSSAAIHPQASNSTSLPQRKAGKQAVTQSLELAFIKLRSKASLVQPHWQATWPHPSRQTPLAAAPAVEGGTGVSPLL